MQSEAMLGCLLTDVGRDRDALWITTPHGDAHLVRCDVFAEQWRHGDERAHGVFFTLCGAWVTSGSLCAPTGEPCALCMPSWATKARAWTTARTRES